MEATVIVSAQFDATEVAGVKADCATPVLAL
jgi:hypothetical protein